MHDSFGLPLISIEHEPHLPALQFHRIARSFACSAWIRCSTSSTTMPVSTSTSNRSSSPPFASPRQTLNTRLAICVLLVEIGADFAGLEIFDLRVRDRDQRRWPVRTQPLLDLHLAALAALDDHVVLHPLRALAGEVDASVRAAALLAHQRRARHRLARD